MFDIGFFELLVIAVVGLVVIGPERLPNAMRSGALWWGRIKRNMRETRAELEKQIGADDIRRELHNEEVMRSLDALRTTRDDLEQKIRQADASDTESEHKAPTQDTTGTGPVSEQPADNPDTDTTPDNSGKPHD